MTTSSERLTSRATTAVLDAAALASRHAPSVSTPSRGSGLGYRADNTPLPEVPRRESADTITIQQ